MPTAAAAPRPDIREVTLTRLVDAPRALVFQAWVDPQRLAKWWGPKGFTNPVCEVDARPGGALRIVMRAPDGAEYPMTGIFRELVAPERLVFISQAEDGQGRALLEALTTVTFAEERGRTRVTVEARATALVPEAIQMIAGMEAGWTQSLERLADLAAPPAETDDGAFVIQRTFDAPRALVFRAWSEAERLARWWGPRGCEIEVRSLDFRPGGTFHYCMRFPNGQAMWGKFVYREIVAPERIVFLNGFADAEGNVVRSPFSASWPLSVVTTVAFTEEAGKTTLTLRALPLDATETERATFVAMRTSMRGGFGGTFDQLAEYLAKG
jgi:uncharacterized protein YndB with AHSA1/START domain